MENNQETGRKNEPGARGVNTTSRACKSPTEKKKKTKPTRGKMSSPISEFFLLFFFPVLLIVKLQKKFFPVPLRPTYLGQ